MPRKIAVITGFKSGWYTHVSPIVQPVKYDRGVRYMDESWEDVKNVHIYPVGTLEKRSGTSSKMETTVQGSGPRQPISQVYQYWTADSTSYLLMFAPKVVGASAGCWEWVNRSSYTARGGSALSGWTGTLEDKIYGETFANCFIVTNGQDQPAYWDAAGAKATFLSMPPSCHPGRVVKAFKNYLFFGNVTEGTTVKSGRIRWSNVGVFKTNADWPVDNYMDLDPDDGDRITAMEVLGDSLIVFKEKKIYAVDYIGGPWVFDYRVKIDGRGCVAGGSIATLEEALMFLADDGFYSFNGTTVRSVSEKIKDKVLSIAPDYKVHVMSAPLESRNQIWFTIPYDADDTISASAPSDEFPNNEVWAYDYDNEYWTRFDLSLASLGFWYNEADLTIGDLTDPFNSYDWAWNARTQLSGVAMMVCGDYYGYLSDVDVGSIDAGTTKQPRSSTDMDAWVKTRWLDMGDPTRTKRLYRTIFMITPMGQESYSIDVTFNTDWGATASAASKTIQVSGDSTIRMVERRIDWTYQWRSLQIKVGTDLGAEPFKIHQIVLEYEDKGRVGSPTYG